MSCVRKQIVLRISADCVGVPDEQTYYDYENAHPGVLDYAVGYLSYSLSSTEKRRYFDYWLLDKDMPKASSLDCYAKSRPLTSAEKERYRSVAIAEAIGQYLKEKGLPTEINHRDLLLEQARWTTPVEEA